ncbi:Aminopeptidase [Dirofilaria immitis]
MSQRKGILSSRSNTYKAHVKIIADERVQNSVPITPPPSPSSITAPKVSADAKDEIELLREGAKNIHGQQIKKV